MKAILTTAHAGGVLVTYPAREMFDVMSRGGYWADRPRGFLEAQIERQISAGIDRDHAQRFAYALEFGGLTTAEVYSVIRDRDCARHGTQHELIDPDELPDRWFRDAWARGHNGGPVHISLEKARAVQWRKIVAAVDIENKRRREDLKATAPVDFDQGAIRSAIRNARDDDELRRVWPCSLLPRH